MLRNFSYLSITGNVLFILWMTWNAIDEGFKGTPYQLASYVLLTALLILNIILIWSSRPKSI